MIVHEQFSSEQFKELFYVSKGLTNLLGDKRRLNSESDERKLIYSENLFNHSHFSGNNLQIKLENNLGLNTEAIEVSSGFNIGSEKFEELGALKEYTNISKILKEIKSITTGGSNLAFNLYKIINEYFLNLTNIINSDIPPLNNLVEYFGKLFDY